MYFISVRRDKLNTKKRVCQNKVIDTPSLFICYKIFLYSFKIIRNKKKNFIVFN
ncbi:hypothetical protein SDC9_73598 [bioreactor metagenome]|uniref:Uncharacterized protein n=1 Tax=bioreactor metagenome TaxID=1076179 RepID=A0A644YKR1_9ZZZZ